MKRDSKLYQAILPFVDWLTGAEGEQWLRKAADIQTTRLVADLGPERFDALEISGHNWENRAHFKSYTVLDFPAFDICAGPSPEAYDFIVAEHVFEHLLYPYRAATNVFKSLRPGGYFLMTTPFLHGVHPHPTDCTRWTEEGARYFLSEAGFPLPQMRSGSWGNRRCIVGNFHHPVRYRRRLHSLKNEPNYPVVVWTLAQKPLHG